MTQPDIHARLVNWGLYVRVMPRQGISPTGAFCDGLALRAGRRVQEGDSKPKRVIDELDGQLVEQAMRKCMPNSRELLKLLYVFNYKPEVICRKYLDIPARPKSIFDIRRYHAEMDISRQLETPAVAKLVKSEPMKRQREKTA